MSAAARFREAIERAHVDSVGELFAPEIAFHSPVTFHPFVGRETVTRLLVEVARVFSDFATPTSSRATVRAG